MVRDGNVVTSVGPATAVDVAFALLEDLSGPEIVQRIRGLMGFDSRPSK